MPKKSKYKQRHQKKRHSQQRAQHPKNPHLRIHPQQRAQKAAFSNANGILRLKGRVQKNKTGTAFLILESDKHDDVFIPREYLKQLFHGDRVEAMLSNRGEIIGLKVLEHRFKEVFGKYQNPDKILYERKHMQEVFRVAKGRTLNAKQGDWVRAKIQHGENGPQSTTAEIIEIYGKDFPARMDTNAVAAELGIEEHHSEIAVHEAEGYRLEIPGKDLEGRRDLRNIPFITIDGVTARDFDDAIFVERKGNHHVLWVAIADVSHYVKPGTALDHEARERGTSVYFSDRAFHMLPRALSENLCSLRPHEPRLAMVAIIKFNAKGEKIGTEICEAVIESKRRATYEQIQEEWLANQENKNWEYAEHYALFHILKKHRSHRGSIDFDLPEAEIKIDKEGEPLSIKIRDRVASHRLIEEFMIAANEAVTEWMLEKHQPFIYRIHDYPDTEALNKFRKLALSVGVQVKFSDEGPEPKDLAELVKKIENHPAKFMLNTTLLRSMRQAVYSAEHGIHFGLASQAYTHFTSPIRRYPDLAVHRLLRETLRKMKHASEKELHEISTHCSQRERLASEAERESIKLKQARLMRKHIGEEFTGSINGITEKGIFIQIKDPYVEGFVSRDQLSDFFDDFFSFREEKMHMISKRRRKILTLGDELRVRVIRTDIERRMIDFEPVE